MIGTRWNSEGRFEDAQGVIVAQPKLVTDPDLGILLTPLTAHDTLLNVLRGRDVTKIDMENMSWVVEEELLSIVRLCGGTLESIRLDGCDHVTDKVLWQIAYAAKSLKVISVRRCPQLTILGVSSICANCLSLEELDASENPALLNVPKGTTDDDLIKMYNDYVPGLIQEKTNFVTVKDTRDIEQELKLAKDDFAEILVEGCQLRALKLSDVIGVDDDFILNGFKPIVVPEKKADGMASFQVAENSQLDSDAGRESDDEEVFDDYEDYYDSEGKEEDFVQNEEKTNLECLEELDLSGCCSLTTKSIIHISKCCTNLTTLCLAFVTKVKSDAIRAIAENCKMLQSIDLTGLQKLDTKCVRFLIRKRRKHLTRLIVSGCTELNGRIISAVADHAASIEHLDISNCQNIPPHKLYLLLKSAPALKTVVLNGCYQISKSELDDLRAATKSDMRDLEWVRLRSRPSGDPVVSGIVPNWRPLPPSQCLKAIAADGGKKKPAKKPKKK
mmetsp:Transcript_2110/g.4019  ORF Transcript_2110/g.4019 Transcript_2110/m.4019 type:complete len:501 (+) Transcript_2110:142-1644(+)